MISLEKEQHDIKLNLVSFLSEGPPHDEALSLIHNKEVLLENARPHFNNITIYTPRILREMGLSQYVNSYESDGLVIMNPGSSKIGNLRWKPKIMLMELEKINDGDILIYRDGNIEKYGIGLSNYNDIKNVAINCLNYCNFDFFIPRENEDLKLKMLTKTNVIVELGENHPFTYNFPNLHANLIIVKKSKISIELLNEWHDACLVDKWIDGDKYSDLDKDFWWSCSEQSILGVIIANWVRKKKHNISANYPSIGFKNRNINEIVFYNNYEYLSFLTE